MTRAQSIAATVVACGFLTVAAVHGQTPIPTWTPGPSCGDACGDGAGGQMSCPLGFVAGDQNACEGPNIIVIRDNRGGHDCPDQSDPDIEPEFLIFCDADPGDDVLWTIRLGLVDIDISNIGGTITVLDAIGEPVIEDPADTLQFGVSLSTIEGDTETTVLIEVDGEFRIDYSESELAGMGALTVIEPPHVWQFYADDWDITAAAYVRPGGRHALHADAEEAGTFLLPPCAEIRNASIQILDADTEEPSNLASGCQVRLAASVDFIDSVTLCSVTGTSDEVACLGPLPAAVGVPAGSKLAARLEAFNGEEACTAATFDVLAQFYCY